ncbi:Serine/threonine-protein kinase rio2 [Dichanthelium oligosanthes]|uniref:Serine/threonine-protein kinase RIO2 n=1 Tax=Dichanthelium oligosanthes TaxID=888268 RepID=A0A1E5WHS5_9POAL|nr:Serine/threonine-protein kinase rio2 [Dichanthelium oligosanthes]
MKLDVNALRYLTKDDFRVLTAVEMGMRNHEIVPAELVDRIAGLKHGGTYKVLRNLLKNKLVHHDATKYDGYRLTYLGYDFLAIKTLVNRGVFASVGRQIGVGKESDIFEVATEDGTVLAMKLHRLGRTSFRAVKSKRDYLRHRRSFNWLYLSRLAALKEFAFMKALGHHGFPVPTAVDCNRHCVIMSLVQGYPLVQVKELQNPDDVFDTILGLIVRLAEHGLIHCDFNEFNIMIDDDEKITVIDFPQMVSVSHRNAQMFFDRDIECIYKFFRKRFNLMSEKNEEQDGSESDGEGNSRPSFMSVKKAAGSLDKDLAASGYTRKEQVEMEKYIEEDAEGHDSGSDDDDEIVDAVPIGSLKIDQDGSDEPDCNLDSRNSGGPGTSSEEHGTSCSGENRLETPPTGSNGDAMEPLESGGKVLSQEDDDNDDDLLDDTDDEEDAELTKQLNKQRKKAIVAAHGRRRPVSTRNAYKDKGKGTMNSKIQRQACKW